MKYVTYQMLSILSTETFILIVSFHTGDIDFSIMILSYFETHSITKII